MLKFFGLNFYLRGRPLHVLLLHAFAGLLYLLISLLLNLPTVATKEREREREIEIERERERESEDVCSRTRVQFLRKVAPSSVVVQTPWIKTYPAKIMTTLKLKKNKEIDNTIGRSAQTICTIMCSPFCRKCDCILHSFGWEH